MDIKCCNISMLYTSDNIDIVLTDIETGRELIFYSQNNIEQEFMDGLMNAYTKAANVLGSIPSTFIIIGDIDYMQDMILVNLDSPLACSFMKYKMYACYLVKSDNTSYGFIFKDRIKETEIRIKDFGEELEDELLDLNNSIKEQHYRGFNRLGDDSIILCGNVCEIDNDTTCLCYDEGLMVGTIDTIYSILWEQLTGQN